MTCRSSLCLVGRGFNRDEKTGAPAPSSRGAFPASTRFLSPSKNSATGAALARIRALIKQVVPTVIEEWKWRGVPVWYHDGMICTGETYKSIVKVTFAKGAKLRDPSRLFNSSLEGNVRRAIDLHKGENLDEPAFKALVRDAVALNASPRRR